MTLDLLQIGAGSTILAALKHRRTLPDQQRMPPAILRASLFPL